MISEKKQAIIDLSLAGLSLYAMTSKRVPKWVTAILFTSAVVNTAQAATEAAQKLQSQKNKNNNTVT